MAFTKASTTCQKLKHFVNDTRKSSKEPVRHTSSSCGVDFCIFRRCPSIFDRTSLVCIVILAICGIVSGEKVLPDFSTVPTPPSFVHDPNPEVTYFVVESGSKDNSSVHIKERKFSCIATGFPTVTYRWLKNGLAFNLSNSSLSSRVTRIPGEGSFILNNLAGDDEGIYQCIAENGNGTAFDREINFRLTVLNLFANARQETVEVNYGDPFSKECIAPYSVPPARTYWISKSPPRTGHPHFQTINSTNIVVNDKGTIFFQYVSDVENKTGDFYFTCVAENMALKDYKFGYHFNFFVLPTARKTLDNIPPTEQYVSPSRVTAMKGQNFELYCIFSGTPDLIPTWYKDGAILPDSVVSYSTNFRKSMKIDSVKESDQGKYACKFDRAPQLNKEFMVTVEAAPYWGEHRPRNINSSQGLDVEFHCDARGKPPPRITFFKNGIPIESSDRLVVRDDKLFISNLQYGEKGSGDNAVYQCKAENGHGSVWTNFYLNLLSFAPVVIEQPGTVETVVGKNATLVCKVFGSPKPHVVWNGLALQGTVGVHYDVIPVSYDGYTELRLRNVKKEESGDYECSFRNKHGDDKAIGKLVVRNATIFTKEPKDDSVTAGTSINLDCDATSDGHLSAKYFWYSDYGLLKDDHRISIDPETHKLTIKNPTGEDSGSYRCVVQTPLDTKERVAKIKVKDMPLSPHSVFVHCFPSMAEVSFYYEERPNGNEPATAFIIQINVDELEPDAWDTYHQELDVKTSLKYGSVKANISLNPFGRYRFRVFAKNEVGWSPPAYAIRYITSSSLANNEVHQCITEAKVPPRNPSNVRVKANTVDSFEVQWNPIPRRDWYGPKFSYLVQYKDKKRTTDDFKNVTVTNPDQNAVVISDVQQNTEFDVKVWSKNEVGLAPVQPTLVSGRSGEAIPTVAPKNFRIILRDIGPSSASFLWDPVDKTSVNGEIRGYKIEHWYQTGKRSEAVMKEAIFDSEANGGTIYDLKPNKVNFAQIRVFNSAGEGPPSDKIEFSMPEGVPTQVQDLFALPMSHNDIGVWWKPPRESNGNLSHYEITICDYALSLSCNRTLKSEANCLTEKRIHDLDPLTKYNVRVVAFTNAGPGDPSSVDVETTKMITEHVKPLPPSLVNEQIGTDHINVTYKPGANEFDGEQKPPGASFYVKYRAKGTSDWIETNTTHSSGFTLTLDNLKPDTEYEVRAVAVHKGYKTESVTFPYHTAGGSAFGLTADWLIAVIVIVILLIIILIIVCLIVRSRGAKYPVSEKEKQQGREPMLKQEKGFGEYVKPDVAPAEDEKRSLTTESKHESETDSMAEYGETENGRFTEDGSFIGLYGKQNGNGKPKAPPNSSTLV